MTDTNWPRQKLVRTMGKSFSNDSAPRILGVFKGTIGNLKGLVYSYCINIR